MDSSLDRQERMSARVSFYAAIVIPLIEAGLVGYVTWVLAVLVCINYLMHPSQEFRELGIAPRKGTAIALLTVYFILLLFMTVVYMRIIHVIWTNPGLIPKGDPEKRDPETGQYFQQHFAFVCDHEGRPVWCDKCKCYKPDRTHHCTPVGRCVRRMDHFCPWVGGIVSETTHKFFLQLLFYGTLYTCFLLVSMAVFSAERVRKLGGTLPVTWIVAIAVSGLFFLFLGGMFGQTFYQAALNLTTVEAIDQKYRVNHIALRGPTEIVPASQDHADLAGTGGPDPKLHEERTQFIILQTNPGENPWDLGVKENLQQLLGYTWFDWFLPIHYSPFTRHDRESGHYKWGEVVQQFQRDHGVPSARRRSKHSRHSRHSRNSEHERRRSSA